MRFRCPPWPPPWPEIEQSIAESWQTGQWGRYRSANHDILQQRLEEIFAVESARLTCSGSAAIEIALRAAAVGPGDEVILAAYDYPGNFRSIELVGARPVLIDIGKADFSISPELTKHASSSAVKAVIASHLYGHPAPVAALQACCHQAGWVLIEDACQVPGLRIHGQAAGSFGAISTLSFGGSKTLTAGCGGAILTRDRRWAAKIAAIIDRPSDAFAMSGLQAAALIPQLDRLDEINQRRNRTVAAIAASADRFPHWQIHHVPADPDHDGSQLVPAYYKLAISTLSADHRTRLIAAATEFGLPVGDGFRAMHRSHPKRCRKPVELPISQRLSETLCVLDQRALLVEENRHDELIDVLIALHDATHA